jgi:hypothetical protein
MNKFYNSFSDYQFNQQTMQVAPPITSGGVLGGGVSYGVIAQPVQLTAAAPAFVTYQTYNLTSGAQMGWSDMKVEANPATQPSTHHDCFNQRADSTDSITTMFAGWLPDGRNVVMTLSPEQNITPRDSLKLQELIAFMTDSKAKGKLNPYAYAMKHHIIQHFKLEV